MRVAYLDCFAGIAGDMFVGALLDAGVPKAVLQSAVQSLDIGAEILLERVDRSGISCTKVHVLDHGRLAEDTGTNQPEAEPKHNHDTTVTATHQDAHTHSPLTTQHSHAEEHSHALAGEHGSEHAHQGPAHVHGRSLTEIRSLIEQAPLENAVKSLAICAFELLGQAEAKIHNVPVEQVQFHEVGAVDAIVDIVATSAGIHHLAIDRWMSSAVNVGGGMVKCAHGLFPVPAPATADLLRDAPTYSAHLQKELVTPTGAALIRALDPEFGSQPPMRVERIGYGAGTRNPDHFPNALRLSIGEATTLAPHTTSGATPVSGDETSDVVTVLETALDDATPQLIAYVAEQALALGALDVMLTPVVMKKGRPGTLLTVLARPGDSEALQSLILRETPTLGLRLRQERRVILERSHVHVSTPYGSIPVKLGIDQGDVRNVAPEYEDCKRAATQHGVPLKQVQQAAIAAYLQQTERS